MTYVDEDESLALFSHIHNLLRDHQQPSIPKDFKSKYTHCSMWSMEESIRNRVVGSAKTKGRRKWARRRGHLTSCSNANCKIVANTCAPDETKLGLLPRLLRMSCFEIAHTLNAHSLFTCIDRNGKTYLRSIPSNPIYEELTKAYTQNIPCQPERLQPSGRPRTGRLRRDSVSHVSSSDMDSQTSDKE